MVEPGLPKQVARGRDEHPPLRVGLLGRGYSRRLRVRVPPAAVVKMKEGREARRKNREIRGGVCVRGGEVGIGPSRQNLCLGTSHSRARTKIPSSQWLPRCNSKQND